MIRKNTITVILFFYFLFVLLTCYSQVSLDLRKENIFITIERLEQNPEELKLDYKKNQNDRDSLLLYYNEVLDYFKIRKDRLNNAQKVFLLYDIGLVQTDLGFNDLSIETLKSAVELTDQSKFEKVYARLNFDLGNAYRHSGKKKKSNEVLLHVLDLPVIQSDSILTSYYLSLVAENYENLGDYQLALEISQMLYHQYINRNELADASYSLIQMGRMAAFLETDTSYFEYFHLANSLALKSGVEGRIENNLVNTGNAYRSAGFPEIALKYMLKAKEYSKFNTPYGSVYTLLGISATYLMLDSIEQAYTYAMRAKAKAEEINAYNWQYHANTRLATCYIKMHKYDSARICLTEAVRLNKILDNKNLFVDLFRQLSNLYVTINDYEMAVAYLDSSYSAYANLISEKNEDKLAQLRVESDYYINRNKIVELVSKNKLEKEKSHKLIVTIVGVLIVLVLTFYFTIIIRKRLTQLRESYIVLVRKNLELDEVNKKLHECEIRPKKKINLENIKNEDIIIKKLSKLLINKVWGLI
ncbi:MAG: hypothetical protein QM503_03295 [Bacteroidota bacterium]